MVEMNVYHWVKKNIVTSESNYNYFFLVVVTGPFLQCICDQFVVNPELLVFLPRNGTLLLFAKASPPIFEDTSAFR